MPYTHLNHILVRSCTNFLSAVYNSLQPGLCQINPALTLLLHPDAVASAGLLIGQRQTMAAHRINMQLRKNSFCQQRLKKVQGILCRNGVVRGSMPEKCRRRLLRHLILQRQLILQLFISVPQKIFKRLPVRLFTGGNYRITEKQSRRLQLFRYGSQSLSQKRSVPGNAVIRRQMSSGGTALKNNSVRINMILGGMLLQPQYTLRRLKKGCRIPGRSHTVTQDSRMISHRQKPHSHRLRLTVRGHGIPSAGTHKNNRAPLVRTHFL